MINRFVKIVLAALLGLGVGVLVVVTIDATNEPTKVKGEDMINNGTIKRLTFDNHEYIMVYQSKGIAVVHNEACKCKK